MEWIYPIMSLLLKQFKVIIVTLRVIETNVYLFTAASCLQWRMTVLRAYMTHWSSVLWSLSLQEALAWTCTASGPWEAILQEQMELLMVLYRCWGCTITQVRLHFVTFSCKTWKEDWLKKKKKIHKATLTVCKLSSKSSSQAHYWLFNIFSVVTWVIVMAYKPLMLWQRPARLLLHVFFEVSKLQRTL